jgi:CheY-like chemotaxis protein
MVERRRPRVLVVDDERTFTDLLATFLEDEGYETDRAYDGEEALKALQSNTLPDLVLSDVMLPKLDGTELLALARRQFPPDRLPFVLLSAGPDPGVHEACTSFMAKPLDLDHLLERVATLIGDPPPITMPQAARTWGHSASAPSTSRAPQPAPGS